MRSDAHYPDDQTLIEWSRDDTYVELAAKCGVTVSSLRDYLRIRPHLKADIERVKKSIYVPLEEQKRRREASLKAWKAANSERVKETNRRWGRNQSKEKRRRWNTYNQNRRRAATSTISVDDFDWMDVLRNDPCPYCGGPGGSIDHIKPIIKGGEDSIANLAGVCRSCNSSKGGKDLLHFLMWRNL